MPINDCQATGDLADVPSPKSLSDHADAMSIASSESDVQAHPNYSPLEAEQFAESRLGSQTITADDIIHLITLLPSEQCPRSGENPCAFSFSTGLYAHGGIVGLRRHARQFPQTSSMLARFASQRAPGFEFTSLLLLADTQTQLHSHRNNAQGYDNFLIGVTSFQGGQLWIESDVGNSPAPPPHQDLKGTLLEVSNTCAHFNPHLRHCTAPWTGRRVVLAGFVVRHFHCASPSDQDYLESLHFKLPHLGTGDVIRQGHLSCIAKPSFNAPSVPVVFELFSGTGRVTACLRRIGIKQAYAVDHLVVEDCAAPPLIADLTSQDGQNLAKFWLSNPLLSAVFAAPVCGTCSRAREIPVRDAAGFIVPGPEPLRDARYPDGLPHLCGPNKARVEAANKLYSFLSDVVLDCHSRDILVVIENPHRSWYWSTSAFMRIRHLLPHRVSFDHCAYQGPRPKRTTLACSHPALGSLAKDCAGPSCARTHAKWGTTESGFATKSEAAYPPLLAGAIASCIAQHLVQAGWQSPASWPGAQSFLAACRATAGAQPKAAQFPALVPEHKRVLLVRGPEASQPLPRVPPCSGSRTPGLCLQFAPAQPPLFLRRASCCGLCPSRLRWGLPGGQTPPHMNGLPSRSKLGAFLSPQRSLSRQLAVQVTQSC